MGLTLSTPPVQVQPVDIMQTGLPRPEYNWLWRRVFVYSSQLLLIATTLVMMYFIWRLVDSAIDIVKEATETTNQAKIAAALQVLQVIVPKAMETVFWVALLLTINTMLLSLYYMIAPSAENIKAMSVDIARIVRGTPETQTVTVTAPAPPGPTITTPGATVTNTSEAVPAPTQVGPPAPEATSDASIGAPAGDATSTTVVETKWPDKTKDPA